MTTLTQERLTQIHSNIICCYYDLPKEKYLFPIDKEGGVIAVFKNVVLQLRKEGITVCKDREPVTLAKHLGVFYLALDTPDPIGFIYKCFNTQNSPTNYVNFFHSTQDYIKHEVFNLISNRSDDYFEVFNKLPLTKKMICTRISYEDYKKAHLDALNNMYDTMVKILEKYYETDKNEGLPETLESLFTYYSDTVSNPPKYCYYKELEKDYIMIDKWLEE